MSRKQALLEESALKGEVMWKSKGGAGDGGQLQMSTATSQTTPQQPGSQARGKGTATVPGPENDAHPQTQRTHPPGAEQSKGPRPPPDTWRLIARAPGEKTPVLPEKARENRRVRTGEQKREERGWEASDLRRTSQIHGRCPHSDRKRQEARASPSEFGEKMS